MSVPLMRPAKPYARGSHGSQPGAPPTPRGAARPHTPPRRRTTRAATPPAALDEAHHGPFPGRPHPGVVRPAVVGFAPGPIVSPRHPPGLLTKRRSRHAAHGG